MSQPHRPTIAGTRHMASSTHYLATMAGFEVLQNGGNAVDAGCAMGLALGVVQCDLVGVAGVAPIMIRLAETGEMITIAGLGGWPKALDPELFRREHKGVVPKGVLRTIVPAAPDAWITALERWGTMSFGAVAAAATRFARDGFPIHELLCQSIREHRDEYARWPSNAAIFLPGGRVPAPGELFRQADLGATLQYLADEERGAATRGGRAAGLAAARDAFYRGDVAQKILAFHRAEGGLLSADDLSSYRSEIGKPETLQWNGLTVHSCGAWCQGPALLQTLRLLEGADLAALGHNSVGYVHLVTEALKLAFADREAYYGDPRLVDVPLPTLLSDAYNQRRRREIDPLRACPEMPPPGLGTSIARPRGAPGGPGPEADTAYCCAVDRWGNSWSATPSDGSYNAPVVPGTGMVISARGSQSRPDPSHPAGVGPGKRPRLTPNPAMAVQGDDLVMPFGTPGGDVQTQAMLQVLLNRFVFGMDLQEAIEAPRFATYSYPSSFAPFEYFPGRLNLERRIDQATGDALAAKGHLVHWWPDWTWLAGGMCAIVADRRAGLLLGAADPRRPSYAVGW